ncbi:MAG TPA: alpha/beta hydrolase [Flavisolibacter sp.]|nr:alpha/beta hydrolase [Flavisolibacter sp.]
MNILLTMVSIIIVLAGVLAALVSITLFLRLRWPSPVLWFIKLYTSALSPFLMLAGVFTLVAGLLSGSFLVSCIGLYTLLVFGIHIYNVSRPPGFSGSFEHAFGPGWKQRIPVKQFLMTSRRLRFKLPTVPAARLEQDIVFASIPGTERKLLCDLWQPGPGITASGLAFIYLHGSAFYFLDKDFNTRPFFTQLAAQGHVIMDVAYRMAPETDMPGMIADVKRAINWMKENAGRYGVDPENVTIGGGSAGAHLALLAAYTEDDQRFVPTDLAGMDLGVSAVISVYGSNDMEALYYHTNQHLTTREVPSKLKDAVPKKIPGWLIKKLGKDYHRLGMDKNFENIGTLPPLLGGHPDEKPDIYALYTVITHVHRNCPPTLFIHDEDDIMAPVRSTRKLFNRLKEHHVPVILHILPQTDHGFDLILPQISPAAHSVIYDVEWFLAYMASQKTPVKRPVITNRLEAHEN